MTPSPSTAPLRIGILAGEMSGDTLGAGLIKALKSHFPTATFEGIAGPKMIAAGCQSLADQERLAVMGLWDVLKRLPELLGIRRRIRQHFINNPPAVFIGIDSPDFNLPLEKSLRQAGIKTVHYVSPSVWAWRQNRIHGIKRSVDLMLTLLPFEASFYEQHQVPVRFVGHPLADEFPLQADRAKARASLNIAEDAILVALLPGSRQGEVALLAPDFLAAAAWCLQQNPNLRFIIPAANQKRYQQLEVLLKQFPNLPLSLVLGQSQTVMSAADAVLMASGTTALEAMLLKRPMVVAYKFSPLSYAIISRMVKSPFVSLPNLLANEMLVPEILQDAVTPESLGKPLLDYLQNPERVRELEGRFTELHRSIQKNASEKAAQAIAQLIGEPLPNKNEMAD